MLGLAGYRFSNWGSLAVLLAMRPRLVRPENVGNVGIGFCLASIDVFKGQRCNYETFGATSA